MAKPRWITEWQPDKYNPCALARGRHNSHQISGRLPMPKWVETIAKLPQPAVLSSWAQVRELMRLGLLFPRLIRPKRLLQHLRQ